jgi:hypothetical protein
MPRMMVEGHKRAKERDAMSEFFEWWKRLCRLAWVSSALTVLGTFGADAAPCDNVLDKVCKSSTFSAYAQVDDDDDEDDDEDDEDAEEFGDVDLDEEDTRDFVYDEDEGSLLVDIGNCEPGKYWMMDFEDGVMLPCR